MKVYQALAQATRGGFNDEWTGIMEEKIDAIMKGAPSGSGIDSGTQIVADKCSPKKLVFSADYHHLTEFGYYDGWTSHQIVVTHDLIGLDIRITGKNRDDIKDYLHDVYYQWLNSEVDWLTGKYTD